MAKRENEKDGNIQNADFVGRVIGDAKNPTATRLLSGWFGDSGEEGYRRLFTDAELTAYVDIPADAILHTEPIRDVQPAGGLLVWIKADAAIRQGGSAASRAARFLQGQVQQDFSSPEKAGYRCVTQPPCAEPTGFSGLCTKQPEVGGAWPCITALPLCSAEPTGFTGKCTHQPWPNPTQYFGCTHFHCPTQDLTHIPWICNAVATGMPGCGGEPPQGGNPQQAGAAQAAGGDAAAAVPPTNIPGCGYTKTWGLCETQLLGCGFTKQSGLDCTNIPGCGFTNDPAVQCTNIPGCGWSKNPICTDLPGCGWTREWGLCQTQAPKCAPSVDNPCITQDNACGVTRRPDCGVDQFGAIITTRNPRQCPPQPTIPGEPCGTFSGPRCPTFPDGDCTFFGNCGPQFGAVGAIVNTRPPQCLREPTIPGEPCGTFFGPQCPTQPNGDCTFFGGCNPSAIDACPTRLNCPTPATQCTQGGPECATHNAPQCPTHNPCCTQTGTHCQNTNVQLDCTFGCTQFGPNCPQTPLPICNQTIAVEAVGGAGVHPSHFCPTAMCTPATVCQQIAPGGGGAAFGAPAAAGGGFQITLLTIPVWQCVAPTPATRCFICPPQRSPLPWFCPPPSPFFCTPPISIGIACTIVQCGPGGGGGASAIDGCPSAFCPPGGGGIDQFGGQFGGQFGAQAAAGPHPTIWTLIPVQCRSVVDACPTRICTQLPEQCPSIVDACPTRICTRLPEQCPSIVDACPTRACTRIVDQCRSAVDACPTRLCGGGVEAFAAGGAQPGAAAAGRFNSTMFIQCYNHPTPVTRCFICPPRTFSWDCGQFDVAQGQQFGAAGRGTEPTPATVCFICTQHPRLCQPQEAAFAAQGRGGIGLQLTDVLCPTVTVFTAQCAAVVNDNTQIGCFFTQSGPLCLPPPTPACPTLLTHGCPPTPGPNCSVFIACTVFGPHCPGRQVFEAGRFPAPRTQVRPGGQWWFCL
jgi:hypothetical protein